MAFLGADAAEALVPGDVDEGLARAHSVSREVVDRVGGAGGEPADVGEPNLVLDERGHDAGRVSRTHAAALKHKRRTRYVYLAVSHDASPYFFSGMTLSRRADAI